MYRRKVFDLNNRYFQLVWSVSDLLYLGMVGTIPQGLGFSFLLQLWGGIRGNLGYKTVDIGSIINHSIFNGLAVGVFYCQSTRSLKPPIAIRD